ncbi:MAG: GGDEF domain-containing protein, partial [Betaproteobacteria bacterium]|nr:GGDEF domain-containing protein [Betaproteobacteria bacterium]
FRGTDLAFRHGGEEFLIVVPGTDAESARMRAEDVRQQASDLSIRHEGREVRFTLSAGVASFPLHGEDADKLVQRADQALYASKRGGRNRVTVWANGGDGPAG